MLHAKAPPDNSNHVTMNTPKPPVVFLAPGNNRSGGIRVTVCMANSLVKRGYRVRILYPDIRPFSLAWLKSKIKNFGRPPAKNSGWLEEFQGETNSFNNINRASFSNREIVISVGTLTIGHLEALKAPVIKLRYNHGLLTDLSPEDIRLWSLPLPTITVSSTIIPDLERMSAKSVLAVVPNGIDLAEYHPIAGTTRDAIGTIYSSHPAKDPELIFKLLQAIHERWPSIPQVVFGTEPQPEGLKHVEYHRLPSVEEACKIYNRAKIWLLASRTEGFPGPLLESMACRCVAISTDTYGGREIIKDGENGLLSPRGDEKAFLLRIESVLNDAALAERLAANGLATARSLSWDAATDKMEQVLQQLHRSS